MTRRAAAVVVLQLWACSQWACLEPIDLGGPGFSCVADEDCGDAGPCLSGTCRAGVDPQPQFPILAATYLSSYPYLWGTVPQEPASAPTLGYYDSADPEVMDAHLDALEHAGVKLGIVFSWGEGTGAEEVFAQLLDRSIGRGLHWALLYSQESTDNPDSSNIRADLQSIRDRFSRHQQYFRIDGRFVVFVNDSTDPGTDKCNLLKRWKTGNDVGAYAVYRSPSVPTCAEPADDFFWFSPSARSALLEGYSFSIIPGNATNVPRSVDAFRAAAQTMMQSDVRWRLVYSFNRFGDGTAIESAGGWESSSGYGSYVDVLHEVTR